MTISKNIKSIMSRSSWIREMFEEGALLKAKYGQENVFDFSLGNPNIKPPDKFRQTLKDIVEAKGGLDHGYMPNTGYPQVRKSVADYLSGSLSMEDKASLTENEIIMTCGAAGALNVILKTILNPGEEIITPSPYFVEYNFYADNHGGVLKTVPTKSDFTLDVESIASSVNEKTRGVLINSPNNPTGQIYSKKSLAELGLLLEEMSRKLNRTIYLISDEPYRKIVYDNIEVPSIFNCYKESIIANSYSKELSIPGERIGYIAVNPEASYKKELLGGMALANRILGFVNAPALMQRVVSALQGASVDVAAYDRKRTLLCDGLAECGYEFEKPLGAFYLFSKTPVADDVEFVRALQKEMILTVPGTGFGGPGYMRIAFCVDDETIIKAMPGFKKVIEQYN